MPERAHIDTRAGLLLRIACGGAILILALALFGKLAHGEESWQIQLRHEIIEQQRCDIDKYLIVREVPVGNIVGLEGRIRCADTREFDFKRDRPNEKFSIRLCEPVAVC